MEPSLALAILGQALNAVIFVAADEIIHFCWNCRAGEAARVAAKGVIRYFTTAALHHHTDEEDDLFPALPEAMAGSDAACLRTLTESLRCEHRVLAAHWRHLQPLLGKVGADETTALQGGRAKNALLAVADGETPPEGEFAAAATALVVAYTQHIQRENDELLPLAARLLSPNDLARLGQAMTDRRRISPA